MEILQTKDTKLYEYYQPKSELDEEFIEHFGILGMHWGQRNGPPYPLSRIISTGRKLKAAAREGSVKRKRKKALKKARVARSKNAKIRTMDKQTKEEIIKRKDLKAMLQNVDKFSNNEIRDMLDRIDWETKLKRKVAEQEEAKKTWGKKVREGVKATVKEQVPRTLNEMVKVAGDKGLKIASNRLLKELVGKDAATKQGDKWQEIIDQLIPDPLAKKKKEQE